MLFTICAYPPRRADERFGYMGNKVNHRKGIVMSDLDVDILKALYKTDFLCDYHLALIVGENKNYITKRLRDLATAGFVGRKVIKANYPAANWLTKLGIKRASLYTRNVRQPTLGRYEHSLGCADMFVFLCLLRKFKDGSIERFVNFGDIVTERDFNAVRELQKVGKKKNGQFIYKALDSTIHHPDGFLYRNGKYYALEFERTAKSTYEIVRDNALDNCKRFSKQFWVYDSKAVYNYLKKVQVEIGAERIQLIDYVKMREQLQKAVANLPPVISKKSGMPRKSAFGKMADPIPLNRIPLLPSAVKAPVLESRSKTAVTSSKKPKTTVQKLTVRTNKPLATTKPKLKLEKRGRK